ncbi:MAG: hypothetical protein ACKVHH_01690 [Candidatus Poseidoniales archaeon]
MVHMSMPRQAMRKMGLQSCCLLCDSPDIAGTPRCSSCIESHTTFRKKLDELPPENEVGQLARELLQMISSPHRWDNDEVHGPALKHIQFLAGTLAKPKPKLTSEEVTAVFTKQAAQPKKSLISDFANQNKWKGNPPTIEEVNELSGSLSLNESIQPGQRTNPSREITKVDRSDRLGEDHSITDRIAASQNPEVDIELRKKARKDWGAAVENIEEIIEEKKIDDDLDI